MEETIEQFETRAYWTEDKVFVWATAKRKYEPESRVEVWSHQTAMNYIEWLEGKR